MRGRLSRRRRNAHGGELDITPFMNLMVILVPFLLVTAVFSRLAVLELSLPEAGAGARAPERPPPLVELGPDGTLRLRAGTEVRLPRGGEGPDFPALRTHLARLKAADPRRRAITLRIAPQRPYAEVVALMDTVRRLPTPEGAAELFPDIALAAAPAGKGR